MSIRRFIQSFKDAYAGLVVVFKHERNFRVEMIAALLALTLAFLLPLNIHERLLVIIMIFIVLIMEILNSAVERFVDLLAPRLHHYAKTVKDVMAGATLLASLCALTVGLIIFIPPVLALFCKWGW